MPIKKEIHSLLKDVRDSMLTQQSSADYQNQFIIMSLLSALLLVNLSLSISCQAFSKYSYRDIIQTFEELSNQNPERLRLHYPLEKLNQTTLKTVKCGAERCTYFYAEFSPSDQKDLPTVLLVGGFHGNEVLGQNVITELAKYLVSGHALGFLQQRRILLYPMVNPYGYFNGVREELNIDINRDFNIDNEDSACFQTVAARALAQVYEEYIIQLVITFHGGENSITYPWGTTNHIMNNKSTASPDDSAMSLIAEILKNAASSNKNLYISPYSVGRITDIVYPVRGGYEDWSYAGAWDKLINKKCVGVPESEMQRIGRQARALTYIIEADYDKFPPLHTWGTLQAFKQSLEEWPPIHYFNESYLDSSKELSTGYGHINRNLMASLALIDLVKPYIRAKNNTNTLVIYVGGCMNVDYLVFKDLLSGKEIRHEDGYGLWNAVHRGQREFKFDLIEEFEIRLSCDRKRIRKQANPDPNVEPQSFFSQSRLIENYSHELKNGLRLDSTKEVVFRHEKNNSQSIFIEISEFTDSAPKAEKKTYIAWILTISITLSLLFTFITYRYCQAKESEKNMVEITEFNNESRL